MNKHPGLMRLGADIAKQLDVEMGARFDGERVSGPVPRMKENGEESGAHRVPADRSEVRPSSRKLRALQPRTAVIGALALAASFALGVGLSRHSGTDAAEQASTATGSDGAGLTFKTSSLDGTSVATALGAPVSETGRAVALAFSDGSRVSLEPKAEARVLRTTPRGATVLLERGRLAASVVHRANTEWAFDAGPYEVRVVGTAFDLAWDPRHDALTLHMTEGQVTVRGCGTTQTVSAGEDLSVACDMDVSPPVPFTGVTAASGADAVKPQEHAPDRTPPPAPNGASSGASSIASGSPMPPPASAASPSSEAAPPPISPLENMDAATLWTTADTARASGDAASAKTALLVFRRRFRGDPRAATAAFLLGTLAYDAENARAEGLGWFSIYLAENPNGALSREALGRAIEASIALDKTDDAQRFARRYLDTHRGGPHTGLATRVLGGHP